MRRHIDSVPGRQPLATKLATVLLLLIRNNGDTHDIEWITSRLARIRRLPVKCVALIHKCIATAAKLPVLKLLAKLVDTHIEIARQVVEFTASASPPKTLATLQPVLQQACNLVSFYLGVLLTNSRNVPILLLEEIANSNNRRLIEVYRHLRRSIHSG